MTSNFALVDAQFSVARVFRPFAGFENVYQGESGSIPIAIPGNLDPDASKTGFDSNLLAGISMPLGAKAILWFPTIFNRTVDGLTIQPYQYTIVWRLRNLRDFRNTRAPYHFPKQSFGENNQFVIPSGVNTIIAEGIPRSTDATNSQFEQKRSSSSEVTIENMSFQSAVANAPLTPAGNVGAYQQGLAQGDVGSNTSVTFNPVQLDVLGDEMLIIVNKVTAGDWSFDSVGGADAGFSAFFGTADNTRQPIQSMGIYVFTGSNP